MPVTVQLFPNDVKYPWHSLHCHYNSLWRSDTIWYQWTDSSLHPSWSCHFSAKPVSEPIVTFCQLRTIFSNFKSRHHLRVPQHIKWRKAHIYYRLFASVWITISYGRRYYIYWYPMKSCIDKVWEWMSNFIPYFNGDMITYSYIKPIYASKRGPRSLKLLQWLNRVKLVSI